MTTSKLNLSQLRQYLTLKLKAAGVPEADLEVRWYLSHLLQMSEIKLWTADDKYLAPEIIAEACTFAERRATGEPFAYIIGSREFFGREFIVNKHTLIPRPESELIIQQALEFIRGLAGEVKIADFGTGSGCLGLTLLAENPSAQLVAMDISEGAIGVAQKNAQKLEVGPRVKFILSDVNVAGLTNNTFDLVVANPPYIDFNDLDIDADVKKFEPPSALFAEDEGYKFINDWAQKAAQILKPGGLYLCEIGAKQADKTIKLIENLNSFSDIQVLKDLSQKPRVLKALKIKK